MNTRTLHVRPLGIVHGSAAEIALRENQALPLAGGPAAFTHALVLEGEPGRTTENLRPVTAFMDSSEGVIAALIENITAPRPAVAGLSLERPRLMGIVNVTPDSFSQKGETAEFAAAVAAARKLAAEGAEIVDVGGESTRPGSDPVSYETERQRVIPVIEALADLPVPLSVDTRKAQIMRQAAARGVPIINDISALSHDPEAAHTVADLGSWVVLMHSRGDPKTMQLETSYDDVVLQVYDALAARIEAAIAAGISRDRIIADPGIGFGKSFEQNLLLLQNFSMFHGLGVAMLAGVSRKGFIGHVSGVEDPARRVPGSIAAALAATAQGAQLLRVHDVAETRQALDLWCASIGLSRA